MKSISLWHLALIGAVAGGAALIVYEAGQSGNGILAEVENFGSWVEGAAVGGGAVALYALFFL